MLNYKTLRVYFKGIVYVWALREPGFCKIFKNELSFYGKHYLNTPFTDRIESIHFDPSKPNYIWSWAI